MRFSAVSVRGPWRPATAMFAGCASALRVYATVPPAAASQGTPTVLVNRTSDAIDAPSIACDDHVGIGLIVRHLVELGHTAIAHIAGPQDISNGLIRRQGFVAWMHSEGLETPSELMIETDGFHTEEGRKACEHLLDSGVHFTAIVAANDLMALGVYDVLTERGLRVPDDVSVTGFDDMVFIDRVNPPLTTVAVPFYEMGAIAGQAMLALVTSEDEGANALATSTRLRPHLVVRGSTASPAGA